MFHRLLLLSVIFATARAETSILDATTNYAKSTEATFDHEVTLKKGELTFHWNDVKGNTVEGRLIHTSSSLATAPSWLGFGIYDTFNNKDPVTPSTSFMVGSDAIIGLVESGKVKKYVLDGKEVTETDGVHEDDHQTLIFSKILQHDSDDGSVTTILSFEKLLEEPDFEENRIRHAGQNVFLWAMGAPGSSALAKHSDRGVFTLDLQVVEEAAEQAGISATDQEASDANTSPVVLASCGSEIEGADYKVALTPTISFHYSLDSSAGTLKGFLKYEGEAWLGHGFSTHGNMIGSTAVIGKPSDGTVQLYNLKDKAPEEITLDSDQTLLSSSISQGNGITILRFEKLLNEGNGEHVITETGLNNFLYAVGSSNEFAYHEHRAAYRIDLSICDSSQVVYKSHMGAFVAHGIFAALAWGIASPFAMTVAWFRPLVPSSWIYIHVFGNVISFFFTFIAVIIALSAMSVQANSSHFYNPHHWVGLFLLVAVSFQVMNGFLRPPVDKKDPYASSHFDLDNSWFNLPSTPREIWFFTHRFTGLAMLGMGIYQIFSGLNLYAEDFNVDSMAPWFWTYIGTFIFCLAALKCWIRYEEYKARRSVEAMHVDHRSANGSSAGAMSHTDSELMPVNFNV